MEYVAQATKIWCTPARTQNLQKVDSSLLSLILSNLIILCDHTSRFMHSDFCKLQLYEIRKLIPKIPVSLLLYTTTFGN